MTDPILLQYGDYFNIPIHTYVIEDDADVSNIPADAPVGSIALVNETGNFHSLMKQSSGSWNKM